MSSGQYSGAGAGPSRGRGGQHGDDETNASSDGSHEDTSAVEPGDQIESSTSHAEGCRSQSNVQAGGGTGAPQSSVKTWQANWYSGRAWVRKRSPSISR